MLAALGRWDAAIPEYRKAIEIDPRDAEANPSLADSLSSTGRPEEAARSPGRDPCPEPGRRPAAAPSLGGPITLKDTSMDKRRSGHSSRPLLARRRGITGCQGHCTRHRMQTRQGAADIEFTPEWRCHDP